MEDTLVRLSSHDACILQLVCHVDKPIYVRTREEVDHGAVPRQGLHRSPSPVHNGMRTTVRGLNEYSRASLCHCRERRLKVAKTYASHDREVTCQKHAEGR